MAPPESSSRRSPGKSASAPISALPCLRCGSYRFSVSKWRPKGVSTSSPVSHSSIWRTRDLWNAPPARAAVGSRIFAQFARFRLVARQADVENDSFAFSLPAYHSMLVSRHAAASPIHRRMSDTAVRTCAVCGAVGVPRRVRVQDGLLQAEPCASLQAAQRFFGHRFGLDCGLERMQRRLLTRAGRPWRQDPDCSKALSLRRRETGRER